MAIRAGYGCYLCVELLSIIACQQKSTLQVSKMAVHSAVGYEIGFWSGKLLTCLACEDAGSAQQNTRISSIPQERISWRQQLKAALAAGELKHTDGTTVTDFT